MQQLKQEEELKGRTVARTYTSLYDFYIIFTDDSFVRLWANPGYEDDSSEVIVSSDAPSTYELYDMGFIGKNEYDRINREQMDARQQRAERHARDQYEKLKERFEK